MHKNKQPAHFRDPILTGNALTARSRHSHPVSAAPDANPGTPMTVGNFMIPVEFSNSAHER
jgi:hypothetical protein